MLLLVISVAWFVLAAFVVILARTAARADAVLDQPTESGHAHVMAEGLLVWEDTPVPAMYG
jgi:hypothetical protein